MNAQQHPPQPQPPKPLTGPQMLDALKVLTANFEARLEVINHQSVVIRARYNMLLDKGFTPDQALSLCTQDWSNAL